MLATDAVFSFKPLKLRIGPGLGQWEREKHPRLFVVQPGLYWGNPASTAGAKRKMKRRGVPLKFFEARDEATGERRTDLFERMWREACEHGRAQPDFATGAGLFRPPIVPLPVTSFVGAKLANARHRPETAGMWVEAPRNISFDWLGKRQGCEFVGPLRVRHRPLPGPLKSMAYQQSGKLVEAFDMEKLELEDQPDPIDAGIPWQSR